MADGNASEFERRQIIARFRGQAHLCERIASACADEATAEKYRAMARECHEAAEQAGEATQAVWPVVAAG
jgi:hypothetical protein